VSNALRNAHDSCVIECSAQTPTHLSPRCQASVVSLCVVVVLANIDHVVMCAICVLLSVLRRHPLFRFHAVRLVL
jgi:hypothetical protein